MLYYIWLSSLYEYNIISNNIKLHIIIQKITFIEHLNKKSIFR